MNFLAHLYLAGGDEDLLIGQMLGDFLEPGWESRCPPRVRLGVRLHQRVDAFTDQHEITQRSKRRFQPPYRRYAGVLLDVFHDHFLARRWDEFSPERPLELFAQDCYAVFERRRDELTDRFRAVLPSLIRHDWLTNYRSRRGVERALGGISRRLRRENPLGDGAVMLDTAGPELEADFRELFPKIQEFAGDEEIRLGASPDYQNGPSSSPTE